MLKESSARRFEYTLLSSLDVVAILLGGENISNLNERDIMVQTRSGNLLNVLDTGGY